MKFNIKILNKILVNHVKQCIKRIYISRLNGIFRYARMVQYTKINHYDSPNQQTKAEKIHNHLIDAEKAVDKIQLK